ncbi:DUF4157 domain-containing protein [Streptomyces sp. NPDC046727]|uniref:eCIS core domain-containing protein n=1 Tax=Streptomyces sp. NPDC046727 TaxID=3155373 RepID=UPI0033C559A5
MAGLLADPHEAEADRVAALVVALPGSTGARAADRARPVSVRRPTGATDAEWAHRIESPFPAAERPLAKSTLAFMEPRFGADFRDVRVHSDPQTHEMADQLGARAFTAGNHVYLGRGESEHDHLLMAHELTHVVQGRQGAPAAVRRAPTPEMAEIEELLSYGLFDWAITDEDALRALSLVKALPRFQQAVVFARADLAQRLRDNLPKNRVAEWDALAADVTGLRAPAATMEDIDVRLSYGLLDWAVSPKEAVEVLDLLKSLPTPRLATTLAAIDYGRLMAALPDARRRELADLHDRALGAGGSRQSEEQEHPGTSVRAITFRSDHGMLKENTTDWSSNGPPYGEPEWSADKGKVTSSPISQSRGTRVSVELGIDVIPPSAPSAPVRLTGSSTEPALNFSYTGSLRGGANQRLALTSAAALPDAITELEDRRIVWSMEWLGWRHEVARSRHTVFVTAGTPVAPDEVTYKRMRTAVTMVGEVAKRSGLDPHRLVSGLMEQWGTYNLRVPLHTYPWELADDISLGAQCIDITNFVQALMWTVGVPGTAVPVVVWAVPEPDSARVPVESLAPHGGLHTVGAPAHHPTWRAWLVDANGCPNAFEAALRFDYGGERRYYPGGVRTKKGFTSAQEVLFIFQCLAWMTKVEPYQYVVQRVETTYPHGSCRLGPMRCH